MNPGHKRPRTADRTAAAAQAPYNFVPLPERVVGAGELPAQNTYHADRHTGFLQCALTTESPLYTRAAVTPEFHRRWSADLRRMMADNRARGEYARFFYAGDSGQPVIPGSSLRGMVRALVEIAGYGKVGPVTDRLLVYRGVGDATSLGDYYRAQLLPESGAGLDYPTKRLKGGYLTRDGDGWAIRPARERCGESFVHVDYKDVSFIGGCGRQRVHPVFVKPTSRTSLNRGKRGTRELTLNLALTTEVKEAGNDPASVPPPCFLRASLVESGHMAGDHPKHWHCAIYEPNPDAILIRIPDKLWSVYEQDRDLPRGERTRTRRLEKEGDPLFYLLDSMENLKFFGPTKMLRLVYPVTPLGLVPPRVRKEADVDLAEAIFGYSKGLGVPEGRARSYAGRVFFTDAVLGHRVDNVWLSPANREVVPGILSSPKPTAFQHYLAQRDPDDPKRLQHYGTEDGDGVVIRGHKLYWHRGEVGLADIQSKDPPPDWSKDTQHTSVRPVRAGVTFRFRVHFENLSRVELGALLWVLALPGGDGKEYRHKLGMGKPLGMGSVKIVPRLFLSDRTRRYQGLLHEGCWLEAGRESPGFTPFLQAFETYVLEAMDPTEHKPRFREVERIRVLLKLLEWPGPDPRCTDYMSASQHRKRPVLPSP